MGLRWQRVFSILSTISPLLTISFPAYLFLIFFACQPAEHACVGARAAAHPGGRGYRCHRGSRPSTLVPAPVPLPAPAAEVTVATGEQGRARILLPHSKLLSRGHHREIQVLPCVRHFFIFLFILRLGCLESDHTPLCFTQIQTLRGPVGAFHFCF